MSGTRLHPTPPAGKAEIEPEFGIATGIATGSGITTAPPQLFEFTGGTFDDLNAGQEGHTFDGPKTWAGFDKPAEAWVWVENWAHLAGVDKAHAVHKTVGRLGAWVLWWADAPPQTGPITLVAAHLKKVAASIARLARSGDTLEWQYAFVSHTPPAAWVDPRIGQLCYALSRGGDYGLLNGATVHGQIFLSVPGATSSVAIHVGTTHGQTLGRIAPGADYMLTASNDAPSLTLIGTTIRGGRAPATFTIDTHAAIDPPFVPHAPTGVPREIDLQGVGHAISTVHNDNLNFTGDFAILARIKPDKWANGAEQTIVSKGDDTDPNHFQFGFQLTPIGELNIFIYNTHDHRWDGGKSSHPIPGAVDGEPLWVGVTAHFANQTVYKYWTSHDGNTWTKFGNDFHSRSDPETINLTERPLIIGSQNQHPKRPFIGAISDVQIHKDPTGDPTTGTPVFDMRGTDIPQSNWHHFPSTSGHPMDVSHGQARPQHTGGDPPLVWQPSEVAGLHWNLHHRFHPGDWVHVRVREVSPGGYPGPWREADNHIVIA